MVSPATFNSHTHAISLYFVDGWIGRREIRARGITVEEFYTRIEVPAMENVSQAVTVSSVTSVALFIR